MKKLAILILMILITGSNLLAIKPNMIALISSDGYAIELNKQTAQLSHTLKQMMEENEDLSEFPIPHIEGKTLEKVFEVAQVQRLLSGDIKGKDLLDTLEPMVQILSLPDRFKLLEAANYLDYPALFELLVRSIIKSELPADWATGEHPLTTVKDIQKAIAKQYYLLHGKNISGIDPQSYGFSIRELLNAGRLPKIQSGSLGLHSQRINNIDGLIDIPGIKSVTQLGLDSNQLNALPKNAFEGLSNLSTLHLSYNQLSQLPNGIFDSIINLQVLNLDNNHLASLTNNVFDTLNELIHLSLNDNQLSSLPNDIFNKLTNLVDLDLARNQLISLPNGVFNALTKLKVLYFHCNQLTSLPNGIFDTLTSLVAINLGGNNLTNDQKEKIKKFFEGRKMYIRL